MSLTVLAWMVGGLVLLVVGAHAVVQGASRIAAIAKVTPLVIGLTIVAAGTGAPEMFVTTMAAIRGNGALGVGNVVGSNVLNVLLVLGGSALLLPLVVALRIVRIDVPVMIAVSLLAWLLAADGLLSLVDGLILTALAIAYFVFLVVYARREEDPDALLEFRSEYTFTPRGPVSRVLAVQLLLVAGGIALLVGGAQALVTGAVTLATALGLSEAVVGLTVVALGTSLPEVATSFVAALRGERDIAVGNVVGSNIFNLLAVLGVATVASGTAGVTVLPELIGFDFPVMCGAALACLPICLTGYRIARWEGGLLVLYYVIYTLWLVLHIARPAALDWLSPVLLFAVIPATLALLMVSLVRSLRRGAASAS